MLPRVEVPPRRPPLPPRLPRSPRFALPRPLPTPRKPEPRSPRPQSSRVEVGAGTGGGREIEAIIRGDQSQISMFFRKIRAQQPGTYDKIYSDERTRYSKIITTNSGCCWVGGVLGDRDGPSPEWGAQ